MGSNECKKFSSLAAQLYMQIYIKESIHVSTQTHTHRSACQKHKRIFIKKCRSPTKNKEQNRLCIERTSASKESSQRSSLRNPRRRSKSARFSIDLKSAISENQISRLFSGKSGAKRRLFAVESLDRFGFRVFKYRDRVFKYQDPTRAHILIFLTYARICRICAAPCLRKHAHTLV